MEFLIKFKEYGRNPIFETLSFREGPLTGDMSYKEGTEVIYGNRKKMNSGFDPYEYKVVKIKQIKGDYYMWQYRKRPTANDKSNIDWTNFDDSVYCRIFPILDKSFPNARPESSKASDREMCKKTLSTPGTPKREEVSKKQNTQTSIPKNWQPKSGVIFVPSPPNSQAVSTDLFGKPNYPWRGLPEELLGKYDVKKGLHYLIITPNIGVDFDDLLEFVEDGNLDFIRTNTIIIVTWETKYKVDVVNSDINDIKKYLGITKQVTGLPEQQQQQVQQKMNDEL